MARNTHEKMGKGVKFERIRRITGYLVGSLATWNNAKKAEERDRVNHSILCGNPPMDLKLKHEKEGQEWVTCNPSTEQLA